MMDNTAQFNQLREQYEQILHLLKSLQQPAVTAEKIYTNKELSKLLNVSIKTLQSYRDNGMIEFSQIGRKIHYTQTQVNKFLTRNQIPASC